MLTTAPAVRRHRVYDPRLKTLVHHSGDRSLARDFGAPRSTANDWVNGKFRDVVGIDVLDREKAQLQLEVLKLRRRLRARAAVIRLLFTLRAVSGFRLHQMRLPDG